MKKMHLLLVIISATLTLSAQNITWSEDVACIVYTHCIRCHNNTNSIAAIPFTTYDEAWANRSAIKYYVQNKLMPPYLPSTESRRYAHEKTLTQQEINVIVAWVDQGTHRGDTTLAPPMPSSVPLLSQIVAPNISQRIPTYTVPNLPGFHYHCFVLPTTDTSEKKISEIEILPTNLSAIYSAFLYADTSSIPLTLDSADPGIGYENYGGVGSPTAKLLYGWVNGNPLYHSPPNMAVRLEANAHLILRLLFAEDAANKTDSTMVNVKFDTSTTSRLISINTMLSHTTNLLNPPFIIPADSVKTFYERDTIPIDISVLGVSHWAQKFCSSMNCYAISPLNDTISLLRIDDHVDLWSEGFYYFTKPIKIPVGSVLIGEATYDNTANNSNNPFYPSHTIVAGNGDTTEQMLFSFSYLPYQINDENITVDSVSHQIHYLNCMPAHTVSAIEDVTPSQKNLSVYPNPTTNRIEVHSRNLIDEVVITDIEGQIIATYSNVYSANTEVNIAALSVGAYILNVRDFDSQIYHIRFCKAE